MNGMLPLALTSIGMSVAAQFLLKAGMSHAAVKAALNEPWSTSTVWTIGSNWAVLSGFAMYGLGAVVWLAVLARWDVSKAYPLVGAGFVLTALIGWWLGEALSLQRTLGILLICAGVALVART